MKRLPVLLPALIAWVALCLPWQICKSDCRTAVVGGWQHDCHLAEAHDKCHGHSHGDTTGTHPDAGGCGLCNLDEGDHDRLAIPLVEPAAAPAFEDLGTEASLGVVPPAELHGLPRRVLCRGTGPPGTTGSNLVQLRSVVLLL